MATVPAPREGEDHVLTATFPDGDAAEQGYRASLEHGYAPDDINVVVSEGTRRRLLGAGDDVQEELAKRKKEGGELGGPKGGRVGLAMTIAAAVGAAVAVPAIGFAAGPIAVALAAAGAAGVAGGLIAALGDWGVPAERVHAYESALKQGAILMMIRPRTDEDARAIGDAWRRHGGQDVYYR